MYRYTKKSSNVFISLKYFMLITKMIENVQTFSFNLRVQYVHLNHLNGVDIIGFLKKYVSPFYGGPKEFG